MLAGIRDILIISTPTDLPRFQEMLGDGTQYGMTFSYKVQPRPEGLAQAFLIGEDFIGNDSVCWSPAHDFLCQGLAHVSPARATLTQAGSYFGYKVRDPERYGLVEFDAQTRVISIEKTTGPIQVRRDRQYFYDNADVTVARSRKPSPGRLENTDLNNVNLRQGRLTWNSWAVDMPGDTGTHESLSRPPFVQVIQERQGEPVACLEEIPSAWGTSTPPSRSTGLVHAQKRLRPLPHGNDPSKPEPASPKRKPPEALFHSQSDPAIPPRQ